MQGDSSLFFNDLMQEASQHKLSTPWLHAAFVLLFVGYGTKMGLAPMHSWKPDAYGEAPGHRRRTAGRRHHQLRISCDPPLLSDRIAAGDGDFVRREIMICMGLLSMVTAAVFMIRQRDFKRLLAYSSVEHMGILTFGMGIGGRPGRVRRVVARDQQCLDQRRPVPLGRQYPSCLLQQEDRRRARGAGGPAVVRCAAAGWFSGRLRLASFWAVRQ